MAEIIIPEGKPADVCALGNDGDVCLDPEFYKRIEQSMRQGGKPKSAVKVAETVFEKLDCDDDVCVLDHPTTKEALGVEVVEQLKKEKLKPEGPANSTQLLDNTNIDWSLWQWGKNHPEFQPISFAMIDFATKPMRQMGDYPGMIPLGNYDPIRSLSQGKTCAGCVINSDRSSGGGIHWMALFVDMRGSPWTCEFFNSTGRAPVSEIVRWQHAMKERMTPMATERGVSVEDLSVTQVEHQMGNTECGPYSLYYIWSRVNGEPYSAFRRTRISDKSMMKFRKMLFRTSPS